MTAKTVVATFETRFDAERALARLSDAGFSRDSVSLLLSEDARRRELALSGNGAAEGAGIGGVWGGLLGALAGGLVAVGSIALPGLGLVAVGPIVAALAGAGAGGAAGTFVGSLVGLGVSENEAHATQTAIAAGKIVLAVHVDSSEAARVKGILASEGGEAVHTTAR